MMKQSDLIELIGLSSTDPKLVSFFEKYQLGKLPKTITPNQGTKSIIYKPLNISFWFKYDITNDRFQPPISPKNDDYKFVAYLSSIQFTHQDDSAKKPDPKPQDFWDVIPAPVLSVEAIEKIMGEATNTYSDQTIYEMKMDPDTVLKVFYTWDKKKNLSAGSAVSVIEQSELIESVYFESRYNQESFPFSKRCANVMVKWLFDRRFLCLSDAIYKDGLAEDSDTIVKFVHQYLNGHVWNNQLMHVDYLRSFLYYLPSNTNFYDHQNNKHSFYIRDIILICLDKKERFDLLYNQDIRQSDQFLNDIIFDSRLYNQMSMILNSKFDNFIKLKEGMPN